MKILLRLLLLILCLCPNFLRADAALDSVATFLTEPKRLYGAAVAPEDLAGRVVVIWNISEYVTPIAGTISSESNRDRDNDYDDSSRRRNRDDEGEGGPEEQLKDITRAIRKAAKGALKDGRLLVIAVDKMPDDSEQRRTRVDAIRRLKPAFPVYDSDTASAFFSAKGEQLLSGVNIKDLAEGDRLSGAIAEAPDYLPGRIILFRTTSHETVSKQLVEGKNIEKVVAQLKQEARGKNEKAEEARLMVEAVHAHIEAMCAAIERDLSSAPSKAVERIITLQKTMPSAARPYMRLVAPLRNDPNVKTLASVRTFLSAVNAGKVGRGDMGRNATAFIKKLEPLTKSKNAAVAAEATTLTEALSLITTEALAQQDEARREARAASRKKEKEEREAEKKREREEGKSSGRGNNTRPTAYSVLAETLGPALDPLREELLRIDAATCNYEALRSSYTKYEGQKGEKAAAAKALIDEITARREAILATITPIQKDKTPFILFDNQDWEDILTVNYPSVGTTPEGRAALKIIRDSEVKRIYGALQDVENGTPNRSDDQSNEDFTIATLMYKQAKLKALQKYRKTSSALGKLCVAELDSRGYSADAIAEKLKALEEEIKEAKKAAKEAEKERKKRERSNNND